ncbi:polysaccharide deacetylase family protein [Crocinitomix sp.]|nr:polysaccharide deacetylase family protein [Crocinitomix sp.]
MITIFSEHITERIIFVLDFCFKEKGQDYKLISVADEWEFSKFKHINYSNQELEAELQIIPQGILFESEIHQSKKINLEENKIVIDGVADQLGVIFYLLTRYESYFSSKKDDHDRLESRFNSLVKMDLNKTVVVDRLVKGIWDELHLDYGEVQRNFKFTPTFDIDVAWAYKNRKFIRSIGAILKGKKPFERIQVLLGLKKDPYDTYSVIREIATKTDGILCFILLGDWGKYDKNIHWENNAYGSLIRGLNLEGEVGIHPSYSSYLNRSKVNEERERLVKITGHKIKRSRQHFLRLRIPDSYQVLNEIGMKEDHSMGFADNIGFRAGTSFPFHFFDLIKNEKTELKIIPFAYMDSALKDYLKMSPDSAIAEIKNLLNEVKEVGGEFNFIWHNSSIHGTDEWQGWRTVLDQTVEMGIALKDSYED